jgi:hypothetical protein
MIVLYVFLSVWAFAALVWFLVALFDLHGRYHLLGGVFFPIVLCQWIWDAFKLTVLKR